MQLLENQQIATFKVLHAEHPEKAGDCFIEIRQWETVDGKQIELVVEHGQMDLFGEVITSCMVMPFHFTVPEVLERLNS
ncbi:MAG TPA: hypothetical protein P5280_12180 [Cyclobacteriaceae bacterium]|nr:hypothetical protein [Cyclobacteriaceae bacterium]